MKIALYQPDIPQNVGSLVRLCACFATPLHIIEPCGFILDDKRLRRVAMDYSAHVETHRHSSWNAFLAQRAAQPDKPLSRLVLLSSKATEFHHAFRFEPDDILLLGRESAGVPDDVRDACDEAIRIPISGQTRSLNVVTAATIALAEALRQTQQFPAQPK